MRGPFGQQFAPGQQPRRITVDLGDPQHAILMDTGRAAIKKSNQRTVALAGGTSFRFRIISLKGARAGR
jgi:hypothetical protein